MARTILCVTLMSFYLLVSLINVARSAEFIVGGADGWTFDKENWPEGKSFKPGDVLVFNYAPEEHNVVIVDAAGFNSCTPAANSTVYTSGNDRITLAKGENYFLCSFPDHCVSGMRIKVNAA
ncbi:uncharacterized protein A4U43_C01F21580 [Asparagus officinalis]|uniref:Plantacyanin n=1 Tax=Asparagus officinalis TaxID=4686 RepID=A0A5P1FRX6_ASPOF|nr:basic blue protein-like [Asparagus officinalis]ONK80774.1 uncharacterized protein A4U43_C01F21580 [Asparagus officinalis]